MGGTCSTYGERKAAYRILVGKPNGTHRRRWEYTIKMDFQESDWGRMHWIDVAYDGDRWWALVNAVMNFRIP
jgi:hypothetical protein